MSGKILSTCCVALLVAAVADAGPLGSTFTYQGILSDAGGPVTGEVDLRFTLWDADVGGSQVGSTILADDIVVSQGRVTLPLDFGAVFAGDELWLAIEVRDGASAGAYTLLTPRQVLTATPYAAHAITAESADEAATAGHANTADSATTAATAVDSDKLDGQDGSYYRAWSNLTGTPSGLDDGDDDTVGDLSCSAGEIASWDGAAWQCAPDEGVVFVRTAVVGPVGNAAANGAALLAAVAALPIPAGQDEGWLVIVEPGDYDLGTVELTLPDWVSLHGSGQVATRITSAICGSGASRVINLGIGELRDLTVENTCAMQGDGSCGVLVRGDGARVERITVLLQQATYDQTGIVASGEGAIIDHATVLAAGSTYTVGLSLYGGSFVVLDSVIKSEATFRGTGIALGNGAKATISRGSYVGRGPTWSNGLWVWDADVEASDARFEGDQYGVLVQALTDARSANLARVEAVGGFAAYGDDGLTVDVRVDHGRITGGGGVLISTGTTARFAATEFDGVSVTGIGAATCVAVWDGGTTFYPSTCP